MIECTKCHASKPSEMFHRDKSRKSGRNSWCKACVKVRTDSNKDRLRNAHYLREYGISLDEYDRLWDDQGGVCAICFDIEKSLDRFGNVRRLSVEHNHRTGEVRGLVCTACNIMVGQLEKMLVDFRLSELLRWVGAYDYVSEGGFSEGIWLWSLSEGFNDLP